MRSLKFSFLLLMASLFVYQSSVFAAITLLDKDDWKFQTGGFVELDTIYDSARSFTESPGNTPIDRTGTYAGENGRTQFSVRNSRLSFGIVAPQTHRWATRAYFEFDLLGYRPSPTVDSESAYFTAPTFRLRHAYINAEKSGWKILLGQYWSLLGWQPTYVLSTVSVPAVSGTIYERTPQLTVMKTFSLVHSNELVSAASIARPVQRDAEVPVFDAGLKWNYNGWKSGFSSPNSDISMQPLSVAVSGSLRTLTTPDKSGSVKDKSYQMGGAGAVDASVPIIRSGDGKNPGNTLIATGEFSIGRGYSDEFPGFTGNLPQLPSGGGLAGATNLDAGLGGYDVNGNFQMVELRTWNFQLQYHLPSHLHSFATAGYGQTYSTNMDSLPASGKVLYKGATTYFVNIFHDCTQQLRFGLEYAHFLTKYNDHAQPHDHRVIFASYFRF